MELCFGAPWLWLFGILAGQSLEPILWFDGHDMLLLMLPSAKAPALVAAALAALCGTYLRSCMVATADSSLTTLGSMKTKFS